MPIDAFTVIAQVLNFLVLVWLMKRFLYKPILGAIEARESGIRKELADADEKRDQATKEREDFRHRNEVFDRQREELLSKATEDAEAHRIAMIEAARDAADTLTRKRKEAMEADHADLARELGRKARIEVFAVARKALADLADESLEEKFASVFARRLRDLDAPARKAFAQALDSSRDPILVRSAFDLGEIGRALVRKVLDETFDSDATLLYETTPDLVAGVEITCNGQKLTWSVAGYLEDLDKDVQALLA